MEAPCASPLPDTGRSGSGGSGSSIPSTSTALPRSTEVATRAPQGTCGGQKVSAENRNNGDDNSTIMPSASSIVGAMRRGLSSSSSEPQLWRSFIRTRDEQKQQEHDEKPHQWRGGNTVYSAKSESDSGFILREACMEDLPLIKNLMRRHLRSLILPAVFYWLCRHAQDFCSFFAICCCFAPLSRMLLSLSCFLLLLLIRVVLELEQYAAKGCPDLANFEIQYLKAERNRFWVAKKRKNGKQIIGCIGLTIHQASPQDGQLVRLVVSPGHRGVGVGSRLLSAALGYAASCRCRSIEVCANSLNASSARFLRNRQFELVQVARRNLMRGDLLRWRLSLDSEGRPVERKPEFTFGGGELQPE